MTAALAGRKSAWVVMALVACARTVLSAPQSDVCDPVVEKLRGSGDLAYKFVGPQCEGTYSETTGGELDIRLVGLTRSVAKTDFRPFPALDLAWDSPTSADVRLRAVSTRHKYYYQMDAHPGSVRTFRWNTSVLRKSELSMPEIGLLAWTESSGTGPSRMIYLPIRVITGTTTSPSSQSLVLYVVPSVDLDELTWRLVSTGISDAMDTVLPGGGPLRLGYYPANKSIAIPIDLGARSGYFRIDVSATYQGGSLVRSYSIYVP